MENTRSHFDFNDSNSIAIRLCNLWRVDFFEVGKILGKTRTVAVIITYAVRIRLHTHFIEVKPVEIKRNRNNKPRVNYYDCQ